MQDHITTDGTDYGHELARLKRTGFEASDEWLRALARDALTEYVDQLATPHADDLEPPFDEIDAARYRRALHPLEAVFIEWRQYLRRSKVATAAHELRRLLAPTLDVAMVAELDKLAAPGTARTLSLQTFVTRHAMTVLRQAECDGLLDLHSPNLGAAGIVSVLLQEPIPDATASSRVAHALKVAGSI